MFLTRDGDKSLRCPCAIRFIREYNEARDDDIAILQMHFILSDADGTLHRFTIDFEPAEMIKFAEIYADNLLGLVDRIREDLKIKKEEMISYDWG